MFDSNDPSKYESSSYSTLYTVYISSINPISFVNNFEANGFSTLNLFALNMNHSVVNLSCEFITNFYI